MRTIFTCALLATFVAPAALRADDDAQRPRGPRPFVWNLDNPCGIAIHPETGHFFIAEHRGVVRIYQRDTDENTPPRQRRGRAMEITGYPSDVYGKGPMYDIGPLGLAFLDNDHLVVGDGSRPDGQELVRIYKISATPPEQPTNEADAAYTLGPIPPSDMTNQGEGNFYGVCVTDKAIFCTCNGDDTKGWVARALIENGKPGKLELFIATKPQVNVDAPVPITQNSEGELVIGQMGEINLPQDSLLTFYDPETGKLKRSYKTTLHDIVGIAYSPDSGKLYALDYAWLNTSEGALYELTIEGDECKARKIMALDKPTAIAFDKNGHAYITCIGTAEEGSDRKPGFVIRVPKRAL